VLKQYPVIYQGVYSNYSQ